MCYSEEQSKKSFIINIITCYILYNYSDSPSFKILAIFFAFVGIMQFLDVIFWKNQNIQDPQQAKINYITTKIAMFANHLQPIVLAYLIYTYKNSLGPLSKIILPIYILVITLYTLNTYYKINYTLQEQVSIRDTNDLLFPYPDDDDIKPSLKWDWNYQQNSFIVYMIFLGTLVIMAYENFNYPFNIVLTFINIFTYILSFYYYKGKSIGRFWCKFAAWVPLFFIIIHRFIN